MNISERRVFATGIQASQGYTTYEREVNGTLYRFVSHEDMFTGKRLGISVSRMTGPDAAETVHTFGRPVTRWGSAEPRSGYTPCACRDCMDTTVSRNTNNPELCELCDDAGCVAWEQGSRAVLAWECQREDAYSDAMGDAGTGHGAYEYRSGS